MNAMTYRLRSAGFLIAILLLGRVDADDRRLQDTEISPIDLIPSTAALCLEIPRPQATIEKLLSSHLAERVKAYPPAQRFIQGSGFQQLKLVDQTVSTAIGKPLRELLLQACSESLVIAITLPENAKPQGVVIAQARDASSLKDSLGAWNKLDPKHVNESKQHLGHQYSRRKKTSKSEEGLYIAILGRLIVMSDQEPPVKTAIELYVSAAKGQLSQEEIADERSSIRHTPLFRSTRHRLTTDAAAYLHISARRWDQSLNLGLKNDPNAAPLVEVARHVDALSASLRLDDGLVFDVVAELNQEKTGIAWSDFVKSTRADVCPKSQVDSSPTSTTETSPQNSTAWPVRIPQDALFAVVGRGNTTPMIHWWLTTAKEASHHDFVRTRRVLKTLLLGQDLFKDVIPALLADAAIFAIAHESASNELPPLDVVARFYCCKQTGSSSSGESLGQLAKSLDNALLFGMNYLAGFHSHENPDSQVLVEHAGPADQTTRWLKGLLPWQPAYRIDSTGLVLTSSRAMLESKPLSADALATNQTTTAPTHSRLASFEQRFFLGASHMLWIDSVHSRQFLAKHRDWIVASLNKRTRESSDRITTRLTRLEEVLNLCDAMFLTARAENDFVRFTLGAGLDAPSK